MSAVSRFAVCAAKMAIEDARSDPAEDGENTAVILSTAYGAANISEQILRQVFLENPMALSPALFTESVANAPAAQIALSCGARGANITVTQNQAGPAIALSQALTELRTARAERVLVAAADEMTPLMHAILDRFLALARPDDQGDERARPFDRDRTGWLASEGAAVAVLELESTARDRGAPILAEVMAAGSAFDPWSPRCGWSRNPATLASSLSRFLEENGRSPADIDILVSGACGHRGADRLEGGLLKTIWQRAVLPPVLAPAAVSGAHGGSLLAGSILAASGKHFGPTPSFENADPELGVVPHDGRKLPSPNCVLLTACAAGGAAGWVLLGPGDPCN
jgi:3-oxoacyl-[acyl-carrier-protein] synthase II